MAKLKEYRQATEDFKDWEVANYSISRPKNILLPHKGNNKMHSIYGNTVHITIELIKPINYEWAEDMR